MSSDLKTKKEVIACRKVNGLRPIEDAERKCLRCGCSFYSEDVTRIRVCPSCKRRAQKNEEVIYSYGGYDAV